MKILGLSGYAPEASAVLYRDGDISAAAIEAWFSRIPNDPSFPRRAARFCLRSAGVAAEDLDAVVWFEKPLKHFESVLIARLRAFPREAGRFTDEVYSWLSDRLWVRSRIVTEIGVPREKVLFVDSTVAEAAATQLASIASCEPPLTGAPAQALGAALIVAAAHEDERLHGWPLPCGPSIDPQDVECGEPLGPAPDKALERLAAAIDGGAITGVARGPLAFTSRFDPSRVIVCSAKHLNLRDRMWRDILHRARVECGIENDPLLLELAKRAGPLEVAPLLPPGEPIAHDAATVMRFFERSGLDALLLCDRWFTSSSR